MNIVDHCVKATKEITRTADTTAYTSGDIINDVSATAIPKLSFGRSYASKQIEIYGANVFTSAIADATKISNLMAYMLNSSDILDGQVTPVSVKADNTPFCPSYTELTTKTAGQSVLFSTDNSNSAFSNGGIVGRSANEISRIVTLDSNGDLYFAPIVITAFTPASGQKFYFTFLARVIS